MLGELLQHRHTPSTMVRGGSKKKKGINAIKRAMIKGPKGPKRVGATKPPSSTVHLVSSNSTKHLGKKAKKAAATAAAWALIGGKQKK